MSGHALCARAACGHYQGHHRPEGACFVQDCRCAAFQARSKYRAQRVACSTCARVHDSKKERSRCWELAQAEAAGTIRFLHRQVPFRLEVNGMLIATYVADFVYVADAVEVVEDVKSAITRKLPVYRLKKKLMRAIHGVTITET